MFKPLQMQKVKVVALDKYHGRLVEKLHELGAVQLNDIKEKLESPEWKEFLQSAELPSESRELAPHIIKIERILDILRNVNPEKTNFLGLGEKITPKAVDDRETKELIGEGEAVFKKLDKPVVLAHSKLEGKKSEQDAL